MRAMSCRLVNVDFSSILFSLYLYIDILGELCETRMAMMKNDSETFTNGHGESEQVTDTDQIYQLYQL